MYAISSRVEGKAAFVPCTAKHTQSERNQRPLYLPARRHSTRFMGSSAGRLLLYGSDMPSASIALAICTLVHR